MTGAALALVTAAAFLHASWNALAKRGQDPIAFLWWASCAASLLLLPLGAAELATTGFPAAAAPFVVATIVLHSIYFYSLVDKAGVQRIGPVPYLMLMEAGSVLVFLPVILMRPAAARRELVRNWSRILAASAMSAAAYTLVLFAFQMSKTGYVVAAREMSIALSVLIGSFWFGEGHLAPRLTGAAIVLAGVACIALAR